METICSSKKCLISELDFMHQAEKQKDSREVKVENGWVYFLYELF